MLNYLLVHQCSKTDNLQDQVKRAPTLHDNIEYADCNKNVKKLLFLVLQRKQQMTTMITMY